MLQKWFLWSHLKEKSIKCLLGLFIVFLCSLNLNSQTLGFTELDLGELYSSLNLEQAAIWVDFDEDGDLDIYYALAANHGFYRNDGSDVFTEIEYPYIGTSKFAFGDIDLDDDLDFIINNKLFTNDGTGSFSNAVIPALANLSVSSIDLFDADNDGDLDIACIASAGSSNYYSGQILYNSDGDFSNPFYEFPVGNWSNIKWVNFNQDELSDLIVHDRDSLWIYEQNQYGFSLLTALATSGYLHCDLKIFDYDDDGDPDIIASGNIILNDYPNFSITPNPSGTFPDLIEPADVNNDGVVDLAYIKNSSSALIYLNNAGSYTNSNLTFPTLAYTNADWGDYDNDGDLDLVVPYQSGGSCNLSVFRNDLNTANTAPTPPTTLNEDVSGDAVLLSWDSGSDTESDPNSLSYNVYVELAGSTILSPNADLTTGALQYNFKGNAGQVQRSFLKGLAVGTYSWKVQSIDPAGKGSVFSSAGSFTISYSNSISPTTRQAIHPGTSGSALTVTETGGFSNREWAYSSMPGGPYTNIGSTGTSYTPNFSDPGEYYIVCKSFNATDTAISNEVLVSILFFEEIPLSWTGVSDFRNIDLVDFDNDDDYDLLIAADDAEADNQLFEYNLGSFSVNAGYSPVLVKKAASLSFDYNNDELVDILLTGLASGGDYTTVLYKNAGGLVFDSITSFPGIGVENGHIDAGDYNNDGLTDFIICGIAYDEPLTKVFKNIGMDEFEETSILLPPIGNGTADFIDIDNDGYLDIFLCGIDLSGNPGTFLFKNNGFGSFLLLPYDFANLKNSHATFGDYNNDGWVDILITGQDPIGFHTYVYKNIDGSSFSELTISYNNATYNYSEWIDYDNDNDLDILLLSDNSKRSYNETNTKNRLVENIGSDQFIVNSEYPYQMSYTGSAAIKTGHADSDTDIDFIQAVYDNDALNKKLILFNNLSTLIKSNPNTPSDLNSTFSGNEILLSWNGNRGSNSNTVSFNIYIHNGSDYSVSPDANVTNGFRKLSSNGPITDTTWIIKGLELGTYTWKVQAIDNSLNTSSFSSEATIEIEDLFVPLSPDPFIDIEQGAADWGDYDNDGDLDLVITGSILGVSDAKVYKNNNGVFEEMSISLEPVYSIHSVFAEWIDLDNDNLLDIALYGESSTFSSGIGLLLYKNMGNDSFVLHYSNGTLWYSQNDGNFGDIDNDGDIDFAFSYAKFLINEGDFNFTTVTDNSLYGNYVDIIDIDNDFDYDISIIEAFNTKIRINDGNGTFSTILNEFPTFGGQGETQWFDYNNDSYIDLLITGYSNSYYTTKIYSNNKDNTFTPLNTILKGSTIGNLSFGDYENDGDVDFFINGRNELEFVELYLNNEYTSFGPLNYDFNETGYRGRSKMGDYDNDGDLDIISTGLNSVTGATTTLFKNTKNWPNTAPEAPTNLRSEREGFGIILRWSEATDQESTDGGLSYNIRLGTSPGSNDLISSMSDPTTGFRKTPKLGNAQYNLGYKLDSLPLGTYYWSVQAIDQSFKGGIWAVEDSFVISSINVDFNADEVCEGVETSFSDLSLANGVTISQWDWDFGDGRYSSLQNPTHLYDTAGTYNVKLLTSYMVDATVIPGDSISKTVTVKPKIEAGFSATTACLGSASSFSNSSVLNGLSASSWNWDFGDGQSSALQDPGTNGYINPGDYNVKLKVIANNGCADSSLQLVQVGAYPEVGVTADGPLTFCFGDSVILTVPDNSTYTYFWNLNGTSISGGSSSSYTATISGTYTVDVVNPIGSCTRTSADKVVVAQSAPNAPLIAFTDATNFCQGDSTVLSVAENNTYSYQWFLNGGAVGPDTSIFIARNTGDYNLQVQNSFGCRALSANTISISVNAKPLAPIIAVEGSSPLCNGDTAILSTNLNTVLEYQWKNGMTNIAGANSNIFNALISGDYSVQVRNALGCSNQSTVERIDVNPSPQKPTIFFEGELDFCEGNELRLSIIKSTGNTYEWLKNESNTGLSDNTILIDQINESGIYRVQVSNGLCSVLSTNSLDVNVREAPSKPIVIDNGDLEFCEGGEVTLFVAEAGTDNYFWTNYGALITGETNDSLVVSNSGEYRVIVRNSELCEDTSVVTLVKVDEQPSTPIIETSNYTEGDCKPKDPVVLSVSNIENFVENYKWSRNGTDIEGAGFTDYELEFDNGTFRVRADNNGCTAESEAIEITFGDAPEKPEIIAEGPNIWYLASDIENGTDYNWYYNGTEIPGANDYTYIAGTKLGIYEVAISENGGCYSFSDPLRIPLGTGIEENPFTNLKIYPNPTPGLFTLEMDNAIMGELIIDIFTETGQQIINIKFHKEMSHFKTEIDLSGQPSAVYLINLMLEEYKSSRRLIVE